MDYCRRRQRPYLLEALVSRLYGHSSSSGALRVKGEADPIALFERKLLAAGVLDAHTLEQVHEDAEAEVEAAVEQVLQEPMPTPADVEKFTYAPSPVDAVYPGDYTGLPGWEPQMNADERR
jgi:2-oxoisovalerate dehydrogenase E1 component alpha subunit